MSNKPRHRSKLRLFFKATLKFLCKAKNLYVQWMINCAEWTSHGSDIGLPPPYYSQPIRAFPSRDADDLRDLIRANSTSQSNIMNWVGSKIEIGSKSDMVKKVEMEILQIRQQKQAQAMAEKVRRRKTFDVIGTIDEDKPCEFHDDFKVKTDYLLRPRSRSCSVIQRTGVVG